MVMMPVIRTTVDMMMTTKTSIIDQRPMKSTR